MEKNKNFLFWNKYEGSYTKLATVIIQVEKFDLFISLF